MFGLFDHAIERWRADVERLRNAKIERERLEAERAAEVAKCAEKASKMEEELEKIAKTKKIQSKLTDYTVQKYEDPTICGGAVKFMIVKGGRTAEEEMMRIVTDYDWVKEYYLFYTRSEAIEEINNRRSKEAREYATEEYKKRNVKFTEVYSTKPKRKTTKKNKP